MAARERQQIDQQEFNTLTHESTQLESFDGLTSDKDTQVLKALSAYIKREQATLAKLLPAAGTMAELYKRHEEVSTRRVPR